MGADWRATGAQPHRLSATADSEARPEWVPGGLGGRSAALASNLVTENAECQIRDAEHCYEEQHEET